MLSHGPPSLKHGARLRPVRRNPRLLLTTGGGPPSLTEHTVFQEMRPRKLPLAVFSVLWQEATKVSPTLGARPPSRIRRLTKLTAWSGNCRGAEEDRARTDTQEKGL